MKILIVDDNKYDRKVLRYMVEQNGHEAIEAENGAEGVQKALTKLPELIISDALMPVMDGFQFLREVRRESRLASTLFLFYSATYKGSQDVRLAMSMGADGFFEKPVEPVDLWEKIKKFIDSGITHKSIQTPVAEEDFEYLKQYSQVVATKLEAKVVELENALEERRLAESALRRSEVLNRSILETVDEGFVVVDGEYKIISANRAFCNMSGKAKDSVEGLHCHEVSHNSSRPCFESGDECPVKLVFESGVAQTVLHTHIDSSGVKHYVELNAYPIQNSSEMGFAAIETIRDVTEKRKLEEQLRHAQKMEAVGQLAGGVAHDFNNMLSVIMGNAEMALEEAKAYPQLFSRIKEILRAAERSANLTRQLLAFARKHVVSASEVDINSAIEGTLNMLRRLIGEDVQLVWLPGENVWPVRMDPSQIDQIMANLCVNAADAVSNGGKVVIKTQAASFDESYCAEHPEALPGDFAAISVSDNGIGMDVKTIDKIFDPFFTTKPIGKGTGLGLATVYGIVSQNNGFISVSSDPGRGSCFKVHLPRLSPTAQTVNVSKKSFEKPAGASRATILLVEDEATVLKITTTILEKHGYEVLAADTPGKALGLAAGYSGRIDLLITDLVLPEMHGRALAEKLSSSRPEIKSLFMSAYTSGFISKYGPFEEEANFLQKPFAVQTLIDKVREMLGGKVPAKN